MTSAQVDPVDIFVSYRRGDSPGHAGRLQDALRRRFGPEHVFYDVTRIKGGVDFSIAIRDAIERSGVVALVIGPGWERRRFKDWVVSRRDWVEYEVQCARRAGKPVMPILVGDAEMPESLAPAFEFLSTINAVSLRDESWDDDVERLLSRLPEIARTPVAPAPPLPARRPSRRPVIAAALIAIIVLGVWLGPRVARLFDGSQSVPPDAAPAAERGRPPVTDTQSSQPPASPSPAAPRSPSEPSAAVKPAATNRPPTTGTIDVDQFNAVGLVSATRFGLTAKGISDPDGDQLQYIWDFGDGTPPRPAPAKVSKIYDRVNRFAVRLLVTDGKSPEVEAAVTHITVRDLSGTWLLTVKRDPAARYTIPERYLVTLTQQGNQLSGRITPDGSTRSTLLSGSVEHPQLVRFGSESAWWNDDSDSYFYMRVSDLFLMVQMTNEKSGTCGPQVPCVSAFMVKQ
jgi:hypothetical protein